MTRRPISRALATVLAATALITTWQAPASAVNAGDLTPFSVTAAPLPDGQLRPYFQLALAPGQSATDTVVVTNQAARTATLKLSASTGVTAPDSGTAFTGYFQPCTGTGCWVTGLPATVTLAPGARKLISFTVTVPAGIPPRQYLAGITAQPAVLPPAVQVGGNGRASAKAIVITQMTVGVAITVGSPWHLRTRLEIPAVTAGAQGRVPRLYVHVRNTGQTFTKATGTARCTVNGRRLRFPVFAGTILPAGTAVLPVNVTMLRPGQPAPCTVRLRYGDAPHGASWSGTVTIPAIRQQRVIHVGPGTYATLPPPPGIPAWAIALIVIAALTLVFLAATVILLLRRHNTIARKED
jgi:hypothetical protein